MLEIERKALGKQCGEASLFVAEKLCRVFADKFKTTLSVELREMVYTHVWDDEMLNLVFDNVTIYSATYSYPRMTTAQLAPPIPDSNTVKHTPWSILCKGNDCNCFRWWQLPAWVQHQFVGLEVAKEAVAAYYRAMQPNRIGNQLGQLEGFLSIDHFHLGIKPADHIRRLELNLDQPHIDIKIGRRCLLESQEGLRFLDRNLQALLDIRVKRGFQLSLKLIWHGTVLPYNSALRTSRSVAEKLTEAGAIVKILARHTHLHKTYDVSDYFQSSRTEWETKWSNKIRKDIDRRRKKLRHVSLNATTPFNDMAFLSTMADQFGIEYNDFVLPLGNGNSPHQVFSSGPLPSWAHLFGATEDTVDDTSEDDDTSDGDVSTSAIQGLVGGTSVIGNLASSAHSFDMSDVPDLGTIPSISDVDGVSASASRNDSNTSDETESIMEVADEA